MRLYHDREIVRGGTLDARDEEECFTSVGRRTGVWLTTESTAGETTFAAEVADDDVERFEVTAEGSEHRVFVVPGVVVSGLGFAALLAPGA